MPWEDELRRLDDDREAFLEFDQARPLGEDRLTPRQRIEVLLDPGSLVEIGARSRRDQGAGAQPGDGLVAGLGTVAGRVVAVVSEDALALGGAGGVGRNKVARATAQAAVRGLPLVYFADGPPATASAAALAPDPAIQAEDTAGDRTPGLRPAADPEPGPLDPDGSPDWSVHRADDAATGAPPAPRVLVELGPLRTETQLLAAGADLVVRRCVSAPSAAAGAADDVAADVAVASDEEAVAVVMRFLSLLPESSWAPLPRSEESAALGPGRRLRDDVDAAALSCRELAAALFDRRSLLSFDAVWDPTLLLGLARLGGYPVAFAIGAADGAGLGPARLRRLLRLTRIAARFRLPLLWVQHGAAYAPEALATTAGAERLAELLAAARRAEVPKLCLVTHRGRATGDFALGGRGLGTHYVAAWAQARIDLATTAAYTVEEALRAGADGPWVAAELGVVDDVLFPTETAAQLAAMLRLLAPSRALPPAGRSRARRVPSP